jgi:transcriptional regulator with XRE-family HTH domain
MDIMLFKGMSKDTLLDRLPENLANNIKYLRERRGLTQGRLSGLCGVPRSTLANLETGSGNPTLAVLSAIASALQITIEELLSTPRAQGKVYPKGSLPIRERGRGVKVTVSKLLPDPIVGMEIDRMKVPTGALMKGVPHRPGTREYCYCESGSAVIWTAGERFDLSAGDVLSFQGDQAHSYTNEGRADAVLFSVVTLAPL